MADILSAMPITNGAVGLGEDELQIKAKAGTEIPISAVSLPLPTGAAQESGGNLDTIAGDTTSIDGKITACDTGNVAGAVTANAGTNLNTSALALEAGNIATVAGDTTSIDSKTPALGQAAKAASVPVTLASDQEPIDVNMVSEVSVPTFDDVDVAVGVAVSATSIHQYQNTSGNTVYFKEILATGSVPIRVVVYVGPLGTAADPIVYAGFTSASNLNLIAQFDVEIPVADDDYITVARLNRGSAAADVYSRIAGI